MQTIRTWHIYTLTDPRTGEVRYVGWTFDVPKRLKLHCYGAKSTATHKGYWLRALLGAGARPLAATVESGTGDWAAAERRWIARFRAAGARLTNATDGGEGTPGCIPGAETRAKMSRSHVGRKQSPESIAKTRAALLGRKQSPEHVAALSAVRKGRIPARATKAAAQFWKGRKQSSEHIAKRIAPLVGRIRPEMRKLTDDEVKDVRRSAESLRAVAARLGVGSTLVFEIRHMLAYADVI